MTDSTKYEYKDFEFLVDTMCEKIDRITNIQQQLKKFSASKQLEICDINMCKKRTVNEDQFGKICHLKNMAMVVDDLSHEIQLLTVQLTRCHLLY